MNLREFVRALREAETGGYFAPHKGRPGQVGGSAPRSGGTEQPEPKSPSFIGRGRRGKPVQAEKDYYHVVNDSYVADSDILSWNEQYDQTGAEPKWKWEGEPFDTDIVSLHDNLPEAKEFQALYGGQLLKVRFPDNPRALGLTTVVNDEGYPAILTRIPAEYVTLVKEAAKVSEVAVGAFVKALQEAKEPPKTPLPKTIAPPESCPKDRRQPPKSP